MARNDKQTPMLQPAASRVDTRRRTIPALAHMAREVPAPRDTRHRIGEYELREPDYRQILQWSDDLGMSPEQVVAQLAASRVEPMWWEDRHPIAFVVEDGAIVSLAWDFQRLSSVPDAWQEGLRIRELGFTGNWVEPSIPLKARLQGLQVLRFIGVYVASVDLSPAPGLTELRCWENRLTDLDLTPVPGLKELRCWDNQLTELDLSPVPGLTYLVCSKNQLAELDLASVPQLTELYCSGNKLADLDLSPVRGLRTLLGQSISILSLGFHPAGPNDSKANN
jgi:hypothetical protein